ncbi:hypothetical protein [Arthrobacter sp. H14-L1]|uniref:hypothetical protein n=1 Tax=Arthrobacter sp. H14-L1 TaxID=2996697 RepID=UPI00226FC46E|nr:hypothetical protein [Arthrobacter sp. H14-L1]MCY0906081.1 hypothetical protein [Arthrobacter sp. H14-L1]
MRDLVMALAMKDIDFISSLLASDVSWALVGERNLMGKSVALAWVSGLPSVSEVVFGSLLTHGRGASVDGVLELSDGTKLGFCHVLRFAGASKAAKLIGVNSYVIDIGA